MMNYSIIIPHKNIPDLLQRCLDSIPRREDVRIIVVADNSDPDVVDFEDFPGLNDSYVEVYFTKKGKGAGYARNIGLEHAKGKWIIFADADDMFLDNIGDYLDKCKDLGYEAIVFSYIKRLLTGEIYTPISLKTNNPKIVFPNSCIPWGKILKKSMLDRYGIRFQEVQWANDVMFAMQLAKHVDNLFVDQTKVYMQIERENSLCTNVSWQSLYCRIKVILKAYCYLREFPETRDWQQWYMIYWKDLFHMKKLLAIFMIPRVAYSIGIKEAFIDIYERIKKDYPKYFK